MKNNWDEKIDNKITEIKNKENIYSTGKIIKVSNYIVEASGLNDVSFYEEVNINDIAKGYVLSILLAGCINPFAKTPSLVRINNPVVS